MATLPYILLITPLVLLAGGLIAISGIHRSNWKIFVWLIITYILTYLTEVLGVATGIVFGDYYYGDTLGLKLFGVPLIIGFNWALVVLGATLFTKRHIKNKALTIFSAGALATLFDFFMEPIATHQSFDYWTWIIKTGIPAIGDIPIQNYIAWFILASLFAGFFHLLKIETDSKLPVAYFFIQFAFFAVLNCLRLMGGWM